MYESSDSQFFRTTKIEINKSKRPSGLSSRIHPLIDSLGFYLPPQYLLNFLFIVLKLLEYTFMSQMHLNLDNLLMPPGSYHHLLHRRKLLITTLATFFHKFISP